MERPIEFYIQMRARTAIVVVEMEKYKEKKFDKRINMIILGNKAAEILLEKSLNYTLGTFAAACLSGLVHI